MYVKLVMCFCNIQHIGARRGGQPGTVALSQELENDVICCSRGKYTKMITRAFSDQTPLKLSLNAEKIATIFVRALGAPTIRSFFQSTRICPLLEKILRAPTTMSHQV